MRFLLPLVLTGLALGGCGDERDSASRLLEPMSEVEWRANIYDGVGCSLHQGDKLLLLYMVEHGAIAKLDGHIERLTGRQSGFAWRGDRYEGNGVNVEITVLEPGSRAANVAVQSDGKSETFKGSWGCGS